MHTVHLDDCLHTNFQWLEHTADESIYFFGEIFEIFHKKDNTLIRSQVIASYNNK